MHFALVERPGLFIASDVKTSEHLDPFLSWLAPRSRSLHSAGPTGRSLTRWAELHQILDRAPEVNQQVVSMVQLSGPSDGTSFAEKWNNAPAETIDVQPMSTEGSSDTNNTAAAEIGHSLQTKDPCDVEHPVVDAATAKEGDQ